MWPTDPPDPWYLDAPGNDVDRTREACPDCRSDCETWTIDGNPCGAMSPENDAA